MTRHLHPHTFEQIAGAVAARLETRQPIQPAAEGRADPQCPHQLARPSTHRSVLHHGAIMRADGAAGHSVIVVQKWGTC